MAQQAGGLLAPTGGAKYVTVSTGHTSQFVKAILAGRKTCQESLKDPHTTLDEGWSWLIAFFCSKSGRESPEQQQPCFPEPDGAGSAAAHLGALQGPAESRHGEGSISWPFEEVQQPLG